jgi:hypothetical protein
MFIKSKLGCEGVGLTLCPYVKDDAPIKLSNRKAVIDSRIEKVFMNYSISKVR